MNWLHISPLPAVTERSWIRDTMTNNSRSTCGVLGIVFCTLYDKVGKSDESLQAIGEIENTAHLIDSQSL